MTNKYDTIETPAPRDNGHPPLSPSTRAHPGLGRARWGLAVGAVALLFACSGDPDANEGDAGAGGETPCEPWTQALDLGGDDRVRAVATDAEGNIFAVVSTRQGVSEGTLETQSDTMLIKYDASGTEQWRTVIATDANETFKDVAVDDEGNLYVAGTETGMLSGQTNMGGTDTVLMKFDANGELNWARGFGTTRDEYAAGLALDGEGNVVLAGHTGDPWAIVGEDDPYDLFAVKFDTEGNELWSRVYETEAVVFANSIAAVPGGDLVVSGYVDGALPGQTAFGGRDAFITRLDPGGDARWTRQIGTTSDDYVGGVAVNADGDAFMVGQSFGEIAGQVTLGGEDAFVTKYDANGNAVWIRAIATGGDDTARGVAVDAMGGLRVVGETTGAFDGSGSTGTRDPYVMALSAGGVPQWTVQARSNSDDQGLDIAIDSGGHVIFGGSVVTDIQTNYGDVHDGVVARICAPESTDD